jgi:hypothetical protein
MMLLEIGHCDASEYSFWIFIDALERLQLVEIRELLLAESAKVEERDELGESHRLSESSHHVVVDLETVDGRDDVLEFLAVSCDDFLDSLEVRLGESLDESFSGAIDFELAEEFCEHVLDFVEAGDVLALDEARFCDSEVASAARADGREVEVLGDVVGEDRMAVDHVDGPCFKFV